MASANDVKAGGAYVEFFSRGDKAVQAVLTDLEARMKNMGKGVALAGAAIAGIGASITAPFLYGLSVASEWASGLVSASRRTGIGFQDLQTLSMGLKLDLDEMAGATRKMNSFLDDAAHGSREATQRLDELGLSVEELMRLSEADRVRRLADALSHIGDASLRGGAQTAIFGRGAMGMDVSGGAAGLAQREQRASRFTISNADVELMKEYNKAQKELGLATKALWASIGVSAAGPMTHFFKIITELILLAKGWADSNRPLLTTIFRIGDALVTVGAIATAFGGAIIGGAYVFRFFATAVGIVFSALKMLTLGFGISGIVIGAYKLVILGAALTLKLLSLAYGVATAAGLLFSGSLLAPVIGLGLLGAGILAVVMMIPSITSGLMAGMQNVGSSFAGLGSEFETMFVGIGQTIGATFTGAMNAVTAGDFEAAFAVIMAGLRVLWLQVVLGFRLSWAELVAGLTNIWQNLSTTIASTMLNVGGGLITVFNRAFYGIRSGWSHMVEWMAVLLSKSLTEMEVMWIRAKAVFDILPGSAEREAAAIQAARDAGTAREGILASGGVTERAAITVQENAAQAANVNRIRELQASLATANAENRATPENDPNVARLRAELATAQDQLDDQTAWTARLAATARHNALLQTVTDAREGTDQILNQAQHAGTFSATAAAGFAGGSPMDRLTRINEEQRDIMAAIRDRLANGAAPAMG